MQSNYQSLETFIFVVAAFLILIIVTVPCCCYYYFTVKYPFAPLVSIPERSPPKAGGPPRRPSTPTPPTMVTKKTSPHKSTNIAGTHPPMVTPKSTKNQQQRKTTEKKVEHIILDLDEQHRKPTKFTQAQLDADESRLEFADGADEKSFKEKMAEVDELPVDRSEPKQLQECQQPISNNQKSYSDQHTKTSTQVDSPENDQQSNRRMATTMIERKI